MKIWKWVAGAVLAIVSSANAAFTNFTTPQNVNLLETWNSGLNYGLPLTTTRGDARRATNYEDPGAGAWRIDGFNNVPNSTTATWTFATPRVIDRVMTNFRNTAESPNSGFTFSDQNGTFVTQPKPVSFGQVFYTFAPRTVTSLTFTASGGSDNNTYLMEQIGAYVAAGQTLAIDGSYNLFWESSTISNNSGGSTTWTDHDMGLAKPSGAGGSITYNLGSEYVLTHAGISHNNTSSDLLNATVSVSQDGVNFKTAWFDPSYRYKEAGNGAPFGIFKWNQGDPYYQAQYVRLSWSAGAPTEIIEFQIFGFVPEPASMGFAAVGAMMLLGRRRSRQIAQ